jgi:hypothetical protein
MDYSSQSICEVVILQANSIHFIVIEPQPLLRHSLSGLVGSQPFVGNVYAFRDCSGVEAILQTKPVLKLLTAGHRNKEVARRLNISDKTVSTYEKRVLDKFNVSHIMHLVPKK